MDLEHKVLGVIPARYASTRFPGKPLIDIGGKSMIRLVYQQCLIANCFTEIVVATENESILAHVQSWGGKALLTSPDHLSGTDRIGEVAHKMPHYSYYVNIQGDEPFINPEALRSLVQTLILVDNGIATLISPLTDMEQIFNPNVVKVVTDIQGKALYFSRHPIPFQQNVIPKESWADTFSYYKHIGIYGFPAAVLRSITRLPSAPLEKAESLEQLRWLYHGFSIYTGITFYESLAIDTPEDWEKAKQMLAK